MVQYILNMAKFQEKIQARNLRKEGESIKIIAKTLGISPASVSNWCRDINLTKEQLLKLEKRTKDPNYGNRQKYLNLIKNNKNLKIEKLKNDGIKEIGALSRRELFLIGSSLYWAEGFKKDSQAGFANSDPRMIKLFLRWLNECFGYNISNLSPRLTINISHKERTKEIEEYWSKETGIPIESFQKPFYQNVKWKKVYENQNEYYGVLRIKVRKSIDFLRKIHGFIEGLRLQGEMVK